MLFIILLLCSFVMNVNYALSREILLSTFEVDTKLKHISQSIITEAYRRLGHEVKLIEFPGERSLWAANKGLVDGELFRIHGVAGKYENLIEIPVSLMSIEIVIFTKKKKFKVEGWQSLQPYTVGYRSGIKAVEQFIPKGIRTTPVSTYKQAFLKLVSGRNDVVLGSRAAGMQTIQNNNLQGVSILEPPLEQFRLHHYIHIKNKNMENDLSRILAQMKSEGFEQFYSR